MEHLFKALSEITRISTAYKKHLKTVIEEEHYFKNQVLVGEGKRLDRVFFIKEGFAIGYYYHNGRKITNHFWTKGDFIFTSSDFIKKLKLITYIEISEDSVLLSLNYSDLLNTNSLFEDAKAVERILVADRYDFYEERLKDFQTLSGKERYLKLKNLYPDILNKAPLFHISSYLGITKETLSRYRAVLL